MSAAVAENTLEGLKEKALRGGLAKLCGQGMVFVIRLVFLMVMARLLSPEDFGLVAMVVAVTSIYEIFATAGLATAAVQRAEITPEEISTLFWINLAVGFALFALSVATAPLIVTFYGEPRLLWVTTAIGMGFIFTGAGVQHLGRLQRDLRYLTLTLIDVLAQFASVGIGIGMALAGFGYWALVASVIALPAMTTALMWAATRWVPGRPRRTQGIGMLLRYGATITVNNLVVHVGYSVDKILIGRFWGADALGLYGRAWQLINIPNTTLLSAVGAVAFPALSRLQGDPVRYKGYFIKGYTLVNALTLPTTVFCALFAEDIVVVVLGEQWIEAASIFRLLAPTILVFGIINPTGWFLQSIGLQARSLKLALVIAPLAVAGCIIGLPYGPAGVAFGFSAAMVLWLVPHCLWCVHGTMISGADLFLAVRRPALASIVAGGLAMGVVFSFGPLLSPFLRIFAGASMMAVVYGWVLLFVMDQRAFYLDLLKGLNLTRNRPELRSAHAEELS